MSTDKFFTTLNAVFTSLDLAKSENYGEVNAIPSFKFITEDARDAMIKYLEKRVGMSYFELDVFIRSLKSHFQKGDKSYRYGSVSDNCIRVRRSTINGLSTVIINNKKAGTIKFILVDDIEQAKNIPADVCMEYDFCVSKKLIMT